MHVSVCVHASIAVFVLFLLQSAECQWPHWLHPLLLLRPEESGDIVSKQQFIQPLLQACTVLFSSDALTVQPRAHSCFMHYTFALMLFRMIPLVRM